MPIDAPSRLAAAALVLTFTLPGLAFGQGGGLIIDRTRPDRAPAGVIPPQDAPGPALVPSAPATAAFAPFVLREVRVEQSSAPAALIGGASRPFIGKTIGAAEMGRIVEAVAAAYARSDIALYTVVAPEQDFADGVLRLTVLEGYVAEVAIHVDGPSKVTEPIKAFAARLTRERPLRRKTLERYLSLIRDLPGVTAQADLQRTAVPGAVRLALEVRQKGLQAGLTVNNRGTAFLGRTQGTLQVDAYSLLRGGDHTQLTFAAPSDLRRFQYFGASHSQVVGPTGAAVRGSVGYLRTRPKDVPLEGDVVLAGVQLIQPLIRRYDRSLYLTAGLDGLNSANALLGQTVADERTRVLRAALAYGRTGARTSYSLSSTMSLGLDSLGARVLDFRGGQSRFVKVSGLAALDQSLGKTLALRLRASGQYSGRRLPASELLALGGDQYGRAFASAVLTGDYGYAASAELAWRLTPAPKALSGSEIYGFVDGGRAWYRSGLGPTQASDLASVGGGVRAALASKAVVGVEAARALDQPSPFRPEGGWRVVASVRGQF